MSKTKKETFGPNPLDVRVRGRFLANGVLEPKTLETHLAGLPDVADKGHAIDLLQPALGDEPEADEVE